MSDVRVTHVEVYQGAGGSPGRANAALAIAAGERLCVAVPAVSWRGRLCRAYVKQVGGTNAAFTVDVLCSKAPYPVGAAAYNAAEAVSSGPYRVCPRQTVTAGNAADLNDPYGHPFANVDSALPTGRDSLLYLVIIPDNVADASTWEAVVVTASL